MNKPVKHSDTLDPHDGAAAMFARYRRADSPKPAQWNDTLAIILGHRSHRVYLKEKLPDGALETIVAAAQSASTSSNLQVWSVVAVEDHDRKIRIADLCGGQQHIRDCAVLLVWLSDLARLENLGKEQGRDGAALSYLELFLTGVVDAALAAQNAVTALESLGLGCCYIGAMRNKPEEVAKELNLPPNVFGVFGMTIGVPDPAANAAVKPRLGQGAVLHREQYAWNEAQHEAISTLDEKFRDFQKEQGLPEQGWIRQVLSRVRGPDAMSGRQLLKEQLARMGVALK
jgi:nitroreductase